jgi:hypothetical protein
VNNLREPEHHEIEMLMGCTIIGDDVRAKCLDLLEGTKGRFEGKGMFFHQSDSPPLEIGLLFDNWQEGYADAKMEEYRHCLARLAARSLTS